MYRRTKRGLQTAFQYQVSFDSTKMEMEAANASTNAVHITDFQSCVNNQLHDQESPQTLEILNDHFTANQMTFHMNGSDDTDIQFFQHAGSLSRQAQFQIDQHSGGVDGQRCNTVGMDMRQCGASFSQDISDTSHFFAPFSFPGHVMDFDEPQFFPGNCVGYLETILEETDEEIDDDEGCSGINWWMADSDTDTDSVIRLDNTTATLNPAVASFRECAPHLAKAANEFVPFLESDKDRRIYNVQTQSNAQSFMSETMGIGIFDKPEQLNKSSPNNVCPSKYHLRNENPSGNGMAVDSFERYDAVVCTASDEIQVCFDLNLQDDDSFMEENKDHLVAISKEEELYCSTSDSEDTSEETSGSGSGSDDSKTDGVVLAEFSLSSSLTSGGRYRSPLADKNKSGLRSFRSFDSLNSLTGYEILVPKYNSLNYSTKSCCTNSIFPSPSSNESNDFIHAKEDQLENVQTEHSNTVLPKQISSEDLSEDSGVGFDGKCSTFLNSNIVLSSSSNSLFTNKSDDNKIESEIIPIVSPSTPASEDSSTNNVNLYGTLDALPEDKESVHNTDCLINSINLNECGLDSGSTEDELSSDLKTRNDFLLDQRKSSKRAQSLTNLLSAAEVSSISDHSEHDAEEAPIHLKAQRFPEGDLTDTDDRARSLEFLLDKNSFLPTENSLGLNNRQVSEHELRIQKSLKKLNVPEWFTNHSIAPRTESHRDKGMSYLEKYSDCRNKNDFAHDWRRSSLSSTKTPSLPSLHANGNHSGFQKSYSCHLKSGTRSSRSPVPLRSNLSFPTRQNLSLIKHRVPSASESNPEEVTAQTENWSKASSPPKSADLLRPTYVKKPYLGWRSQEKLDKILSSGLGNSGSSSSSIGLSVYRPPPERLAAGLLASSIDSRPSCESQGMTNVDLSKHHLASTHSEKTSDTHTQACDTPGFNHVPETIMMTVKNRKKLQMKPLESLRAPAKRYQLWMESSFVG